MAVGPITPSPVGSLPWATFEDRLSSDSRWAMSEGSLFFEGKGAVQESLRRIAQRLNELGIPYAIAGGIHSAEGEMYPMTTDPLDARKYAMAKDLEFFED